MAGVQDIPVVWANETHDQATLSDLLTLPDQTGADMGSTLPRAIIVSGISENQLHGLMTICRKTGMQQSLWAALTPTSETWPLAQLLTELQAERKALSKRGKK
jgi:ornithine carbamoyltransferase